MTASIPAAFHARARNCPGHAAIVTPDRAYTLGEVDRVSGAVAAFLVGFLLTGEVANTVRGRLGSLRDLFAAIFFLFFGLATNFAELLQVLPAVLLFVLIGVAGKFAVGWWIAKDMVDKFSWIRAGAFLTPRGEFSMVIAALAGPAVLSVNLQALTLSYVTLTAVIGSIVLRFLRSGFDK
jgi:CPA2 family monovalent cation:H+ antiporter-2